MVNSQQIVKGALEYADRNIMPKLEDSKQFLAGMVLGVAGGKVNELIASLSQMPMVSVLGVVRPNGDIDLDALYAAAAAQMDKQKSLPIDIPIIGRMTFDRSDLDELYRTICRQ